MEKKLDLAALIEQMPETDKDIQARKAAEQSATQAQAEEKPGEKKNAAQPPKMGEASKFTGPDPEAANKIFESILAAGPEAVLELLKLIRDPSDTDFKNYKAGYVLHGLVLYASRKGQEERKKMLAKLLAGELGKESYSKAVRGFFIRELQLIGDSSNVNEIARQLSDDELCEPATQALLAIREGASQAFEAALSKVSGRNRVTITQALGVLRDTAAIGALQKALADADADVRVAAAWGLANIAAPETSASVLKLADGAENWERIQTTKACLVLAEKLSASGKSAEAKRIYLHLQQTRTDKSEVYIKGLAEKALKAM